MKFTEQLKNEILPALIKKREELANLDNLQGKEELLKTADQGIENLEAYLNAYQDGQEPNEEASKKMHAHLSESIKEYDNVISAAKVQLADDNDSSNSEEEKEEETKAATPCLNPTNNTEDKEETKKDSKGFFANLYERLKAVLNSIVNVINRFMVKPVVNAGKATAGFFAGLGKNKSQQSEQTEAEENKQEDQPSSPSVSN